MKKYYIIFFIAFIFVDIVIFLLYNKYHHFPEYVKSQLITKSLEEQTKLLPSSSHPLKTSESKNIFIYDTSIVINNFPKLPHINFVALNASAIKDSVNRIGFINYLQLSRIKKESDTVLIYWTLNSGIYSHKLKKIIYKTKEISTFKYHRTSKGWVGGNSSIIWMDNSGVK